MSLRQHGNVCQLPYVAARGTPMSLVVTAFDEGLDSDAVLCSGTVSLGAKVGLQTGPETVTVPLRATSVPDKPTTPAGTVRMTIALG